MTVEEQFEKLLFSVERFKESYFKDKNKRKAVGDMDYVKDRSLSIIHMLIAEIEDEEGKF